MNARVHHIIAFHEITITECGRMLAGIPDVNDMSGQRMWYGDELAFWDNSQESSNDSPTCPACWSRYHVECEHDAIDLADGDYAGPWDSRQAESPR